MAKTFENFRKDRKQGGHIVDGIKYQTVTTSVKPHSPTADNIKVLAWCVVSVVLFVIAVKAGN